MAHEKQLNALVDSNKTQQQRTLEMKSELEKMRLENRTLIEAMRQSQTRVNQLQVCHINVYLQKATR